MEKKRIDNTIKNNVCNDQYETKRFDTFPSERFEMDLAIALEEMIKKDFFYEDSIVINQHECIIIFVKKV
jgi:hypothetical protein